MADDELAVVHPLRPDGPAGGTLASVGAHVLAALPGVVPSMGEAYRREVAEYAAMDAEDFDAVLRTSGSFVGRFAAALADGDTDPLPDHVELAAAGRRRQQAGISLDAAMHAFRIASRVGWTAIADASSAVAPALVSDLAGRWLEYADRASTAFAEGHTSATSDQLRRLDARRQALVSDLLAADDESAARAVAATHGVGPADAYAPVLVATTNLATIDRAASMVPEGAIAGRRGDRYLVLVPDGFDPTRVAAGLAGEATVSFGVPARLGAALAAEVAAAESVLATAVRLGATGAHGPDDLPLHRALHEHDGLRRTIAERVLAPLVAADPDGIFRATLRAYLADGTVRSVATSLFVHANTVTYRLRRVRDCTGLDPRVPADAARLVLALALEDLTATRPSPSPHQEQQP